MKLPNAYPPAPLPQTTMIQPLPQTTRTPPPSLKDTHQTLPFPLSPLTNLPPPPPKLHLTSTPLLFHTGSFSSTTCVFPLRGSHLALHFPLPLYAGSRRLLAERIDALREEKANIVEARVVGLAEEEALGGRGRAGRGEVSGEMGREGYGEGRI